MRPSIEVRTMPCRILVASAEPLPACRSTTAPGDRPCPSVPSSGNFIVHLPDGRSSPSRWRSVRPLLPEPQVRRIEIGRVQRLLGQPHGRSRRSWPGSAARSRRPPRTSVPARDSRCLASSFCTYPFRRHGNRPTRSTRSTRSTRWEHHPGRCSLSSNQIWPDILVPTRSRYSHCRNQGVISLAYFRARRVDRAEFAGRHASPGNLWRSNR